MNTAKVLFDETTDKCEVCIVVMDSRIDQTHPIPTVWPGCHIDWPE